MPASESILPAKSTITNDLPITTIKPSSGWAALNLREIWDYRDLLVTLATRDLKIRYKQTVLGVLWVILQQFVSVLIFAVIFGVFAQLPSDGLPHAVFINTGFLCWNLFNGVTSRVANSMLGNSNLISKVYFPRLLIPLAGVMSVLIDFVITAGVTAVFLFAFKIPLTLNILALPFFMLLTILIATGIGLVLATLNVQYRDFVYAMPFMLQVLFYASPIIFPSSMITDKLSTLFAENALASWFGFLFTLNPVVGLVEGFRWSLLGKSSLTPAMVISDIIFAIALFAIGTAVFRRFERRFVDVI
ncbi:MAG: ABC transporter permease [Chloroflexota bacterium]|jgi:lipopolysaccharide transport system permease protein|nr:ABC transporter permease [Chloroflexota bacterium]